VTRAFRWKLAAPCEAADLMRVEGTLVVMASGHEDGWSSCWAKGSRLLLDLFVEAWRRGGLDAAIAEVHATFPPRARELVPPDPDGWIDPGGTILAAELTAEHLAIRWIGGELALLLRDGAIVARSTPHTLREAMRAAGTEIPEGAQVPNVLTQAIFGEGRPLVVGALDVEVRAGDRLIVVSREVQRVLTAEQIARGADAEAIVEAAFATGTIPAAAAIDYPIVR